jgi:hypothetical protein
MVDITLILLSLSSVSANLILDTKLLSFLFFSSGLGAASKLAVIWNFGWVKNMSENVIIIGAGMAGLVHRHAEQVCLEVAPVENRLPLPKAYLQKVSSKIHVSQTILHKEQFP